MPTVNLSPDALLRIEGGEIVTWAECERRLATRTPAPEVEVVESFDAWLYGQEGYGLRVERLSEDLRYPIDKVLPWLKAAFDVGRASLVVPVGVSREDIARIIALDLARQDDLDWQPDAEWCLTWAVVDQPYVDFGEIADRVLAALRPTDTGRE